MGCRQSGSALARIGRRHVNGALALVDYHAGTATLHVTDIPLLGVVHRHVARAAGLTVERRQRGSLAERRLWHWSPAGADDHVRAGHAAGVQPDVTRACLAKRDLLVLAAVLAD